MAAPLKIFGTAFSLTLGAWRLQLRIDLDEVTDDAEAVRSSTAPSASALGYAQNDSISLKNFLSS